MNVLYPADDRYVTFRVDGYAVDGGARDDYALVLVDASDVPVARYVFNDEMPSELRGELGYELTPAAWLAAVMMDSSDPTERCPDCGNGGLRHANDCDYWVAP